MQAITKADMGQALKQLAAKKPFDKISVADITAVSGYNRQTFYYHFQDKYELLNWIYHQEIFAELTDGISFENWDSHLRKMLDHMKKESTFYQNTIKYARENFQDHLFHITTELFMEAIDLLDKDRVLQRQDKRFYAGFYSYGVCGLVIDWVKRGMKESPGDFSINMKSLVLSSERAAYRYYEGEDQET